MMTHNAKYLFGVALIVFGIQAASAQLETLVRATELSPSNIIFPQSTNGTMTFRPCSGECDEEYERARLSEATQFTVNGKGVKFDEFLEGLAIIKASKESYALISVDTKSNTVVSIEVQG